MDCGGVTFDEPGGDTRPPLRSVSDLPDGTTGEKLKALFEADFEWQLRDNPEFATQAGFHDYDCELQDLKPQSFEDRLAHIAEVKAALWKLSLDSATDVTESERLYAELLADAVDGEARGIELGCHLSPVTSIGVGGVVENFLELLEWMRFEDDEDMKVYINRMMAFPKQVEGYMDLLAYGSCRMGVPASKSMLGNVPSRLKELLDSNMDELREPLKGKDIAPEIAESVDQAIENCFKHSVRRLENFVNEFYMDRAREEPGVRAVRNGEKVYEECLRFHTTTMKSAQEIHDLGLQEVARIEARFQKEVLDAVSFKGSLTEFANGLKADKANFYDSEDALLDGYRSLVAKITEVLPKYFSKLPASKLEVVPKRCGPPAYYFAGTPDGKRPGRFYVNVTSLDERPRYEMVALALHEGVPGHHLQVAIASENTELPRFLRYIEDRRYEYGPARRPLYTGYLEGWALYCEHLGEEMGMYTTPYELFGRLSMEMMRAVRLVVDTGIHAFGWSVEKAAGYMEEKTGMAANECLKECNRYAAWPGQACAYKVGQLAIEEMRSKAEAALGGKFSLLAFHDLLLRSGPLPLEVLARRCDEWVKAQGASGPVDAR